MVTSTVQRSKHTLIGTLNSDRLLLYSYSKKHKLMGASLLKTKNKTVWHSVVPMDCVTVILEELCT